MGTGAKIKRTSPRLGTVRLAFLAVALTVVPVLPVDAYEHKNSAVDFLDYSDTVVEENLNRGRPFFLLFSARWCYWCKEFNRKTLTDERVYTFLNKNFVNVFIDADIHRSAFRKYRALGVPYAVFLNPDGTVYYKYAGTLYGQAFIEVIQDIRKNMVAGKAIYEEEEKETNAYVAPTRLSAEALQDLAERFTEEIVEQVDTEYYGIGSSEKAILPRTFGLLADDTATPSAAGEWIGKTLMAAVERIFDPVEGGFFRYAETREWQRPRYEKMADLNAGAALLLYRIDARQKSPALRAAADLTIDYLTSTLYDTDLGTFLSFQESAPAYYALSRERRAAVRPPAVSSKIFIDRLASTLTYLIDVLEYAPSPSLQERIARSLAFLEGAAGNRAALPNYYDRDARAWQGKGGLPEYALLARLFARASRQFGEGRFEEIANWLVDEGVRRYFDSERGIFRDSDIGPDTDWEYLMEMNGLLAQTMLALTAGPEERYAGKIRSVITFFSGMEQLLDERLWEANDWQFAERYAPYLRAARGYLTRRPQAASD